jgi:hypothetical protein
MPHSEQPFFHDDEWPHHLALPPSDEGIETRVDQLVRTAGLVCIGSMTVVVGDLLCNSIVGEAVAHKTAAISGVLWLIVSGRMKTVLEALDRPGRSPS